MTTEHVLPSGRFATIKRITWRDWLVVRGVTLLSPRVDAMSIMAAHCVTIDGQHVTIAEVMDMDVRDAMALSRALDARINGPVLQDSKQ